MKKKTTSRHNSRTVLENLPVSKQTAGGVTGAVLGGVIGGPVAAVAGAIAGTIMGNRAAHGKPLIAPSVKKTAGDAVTAARKRLPAGASRTLKKARAGMTKLQSSARRTIAAVKNAVRKAAKKPRPKKSPARKRS